MFEVTKSGKICSDIQKQNITTISQCKRAAKQLEKPFADNHTAIIHHPKGCILLDNHEVHWNENEAGQRDNGSKSICTMGCKYILIYCKYDT